MPYVDMIGNRFRVSALPTEDPEAVADRLHLMTPAWLADGDTATALASWPLLVQLSRTWPDELTLSARAHEYHTRETAARMLDDDPVPVTPGQTLYPHQEIAARMIRGARKVLLADDPGTGKTISALAGIYALEKAGKHPYPVLVVAPASMVSTWAETAKKWLPNATVVEYMGPKRKALEHADVRVTSYATAGRDGAEVLKRLRPQTIVIDECHSIKGSLTLQGRAVRVTARACGNVIALSGTPITRSHEDLWGTLAAIDYKAWPSKTRWVDRYCDVVRTAYSDKVIGLKSSHKRELSSSLMGSYRRVNKSQLMDALPPKVYSKRTVDLPAKWRKVYDDLARDMFAETDGGLVTILDPLQVFLRLTQLANSACDFQERMEEGPDGFPVMRLEVTPKAPFWKLSALREVLEERPDSQVLIFAPFRQLVLEAYRVCQQMKRNSGVVIGGQDLHERGRVVDAFQAGDLRTLCLTTQAGGTGLTLTAADTVVFLQRPWNLVDAIQAEDRAHRIGSERHKSINIIDIVARNTIDASIHQALSRKSAALTDVYNLAPEDLRAMTRGEL